MKYKESDLFEVVGVPQEGLNGQIVSVLGETESKIDCDCGSRTTFFIPHAIVDIEGILPCGCSINIFPWEYLRKIESSKITEIEEWIKRKFDNEKVAV